MSPLLRFSSRGHSWEQCWRSLQLEALYCSGRLGGNGEPGACHRCLPGSLSLDLEAISQEWAVARSLYLDGLPEILSQ